MMNKKKVIAGSAGIVAVFAAALSANVAFANESGFTFTPGVGYIDYDSDRSTEIDEINMVANPDSYDDDAFYSVGLGYRWNSPWQAEVVYAEGDTGTSAGDIDFSQVRLDGLYHLATDNNVVPYFVFGAGQNDFDEPLEGGVGRRQESIVNYGAGIKYALNDLFSLRSDVRGVTSLDEEDTDVTFFLGFQFKFGGGHDRPAPTPVPVAASAPVDADADGDGVADSQDDCPNTSAGVEVDSNGCALDDDNDGVPNHRDECPGSDAGAKVDSEGCYITLSETKEIELNVNFPSNSSVIEAKYLSEIKEVADFMRSYPQTNTVIEGHTDSGGAADYNQELSERRASKVMDALVDTYDVDSSRVSAVGYGEAKPIASNDNAAGRAENRRVVAVISATVEKRAE